MIKFFRKIRQKLLSENNFSKYLTYAIGEIILVVIGILIALQVNSLNNNKIALKKEIIYLKEIEKSLRFDLENEINPAIIYIEDQREKHRILMVNLEIDSAGVSSDSLQKLITNVVLPWDLAINTTAFDNLNSTGIDLITNDTLRSEISYFYGYEILFSLKHSKMHLQWSFENLIPVFIDNTNYWSGELSKSEIEFLRTDLVANNRFHFNNRFFLSYGISNYKKLKTKAEELLKKIQIEINKLEKK